MKKGLTLLEVLITVCLISILLGAIWVVYDAGFKCVLFGSIRAEIKGSSGRFFINLPLELRKATAITSAEQRSINFTIDTDDNGLNEAIQYVWSGTAGDSLNKISNTTTPIINAVNNFSFFYYDENNTLLSFPVTASLVRLIAIDLTASDKNETFRLRCQVRPRNF